ncbi:MAG: hypothetical protein KAQ68_08640 [Clostridiales bacterium]|nr:hypothetical protein [Clostridiales bacterium]
MSIIGKIYGAAAYFKHSRGEYENAEKLYETAMKRGLNKLEHQGAYAVLIMRKGEFERAKDIINKTISKRPQMDLRIKLRINRAITNIKLGNIKEARVALEDIHNNGGNKKVYQILGYLYVLINDKKAESYNLEAYDYDEEDSIILDNLAQYYINKKDYIKAREYAEKAYEHSHNLVDVLHHLVLIEEQANNKEKAKEYSQQMMNANITALNDISIDQRDEVNKRIMGV